MNYIAKCIYTLAHISTTTTCELLHCEQWWRYHICLWCLMFWWKWSVCWSQWWHLVVLLGVQIGERRDVLYHFIDSLWNPNALQFKYALRQIIIRNSIEPSKTCNCTNFDDALSESEGMLQFLWKRSQQIPEQIAEHDDDNMIMAEQLLIQNDLDNPNLLRDNILYYVAGYIVKTLLVRIQCQNCKSEFLLILMIVMH